jgi:ATP-dependent exoDNAse (exonuclease V) beta subunit
MTLPTDAPETDHGLTHPVTVVDAGAGSGKTRTTVAAVFELLARRPEATLDQFVLITFTNKAADELRRRLEDALAELQARAPDAAGRRRWTRCRERLAGAYVGTIHGFCSQVLRAFGYGALFARLSDFDYSRGRLYESIEEVLTGVLLGPADNPLRRARCRDWRLYDLQRLIRDVYDAIRNRGLDPARVAAATARQAADEGQAFRAALAAAVAEVHSVYAQRKGAENKVDATDLLLHAAQVLEGPDGPAVARNLARRYRYLFVDEFQDTDALQKRILDRLQPRLAAVMVVGDAKQSIYGFRGAGLSLDELAAKKGVDVLRLSISRRPTEQLLRAYNALFASMSRPNAAFGPARRYPELGTV